MRVGIIIGFLAVLLIGSSTDAQKLSKSFYNLELPGILNDVRRKIAVKHKIPNMYELVLDHELCQRLESPQDGFTETSRRFYFQLTDYNEEYFQEKTKTFLKQSDSGKMGSLDEYQKKPFPGLENVLPAQKKVCCRNSNTYGVCVFGPEGTLNSWPGDARSSCQNGYKIYKGLCTLESRIPIQNPPTIINTAPNSNELTDAPNFHNETLPRMFNEIRSGVAIERKIPNMYELVLDQKLCQGLDIYPTKSSRGAYFNLTGYKEKIRKEIKRFLKKNDSGKMGSLDQENPVSGLEYILPEQKKVCCQKYHNEFGRCVFGPEGTLNSWFIPPGDAGSSCQDGYTNYTGLCTHVSRTPKFYNETLPRIFNEIRRNISNERKIPNMHKLVVDSELCQRIKSNNYTGNYGVFRYTMFPENALNKSDYFKDQTYAYLEKNETELCQELKNETYTQSNVMKGLEYIVPAQRKVCCDKYPNELVICLFGDEGTLSSLVNIAEGIPGSNCDLKPPIASTSDPTSANNSTIIHGTESSEVTRIPLVYLRPTENPDLEKRLKKYLAEETDGDEPDDGDPLNEYEYYDYDSSSSISILVTVVFVCFLFLYNK
uniref:Peptidase S1 domain-containing protein n=1 Tax=Caenorhabditis tropicalis TaxID=1561998 RepID=A0A1I7T1I1_9PELO